MQFGNEIARYEILVREAGSVSKAAAVVQLMQADQLESLGSDVRQVAYALQEIDKEISRIDSSASQTDMSAVEIALYAVADALQEKK